MASAVGRHHGGHCDHAACHDELEYLDMVQLCGVEAAPSASPRRAWAPRRYPVPQDSSHVRGRPGEVELGAEGCADRALRLRVHAGQAAEALLMHLAAEGHPRDYSGSSSWSGVRYAARPRTRKRYLQAQLQGPCGLGCPARARLLEACGRKDKSSASGRGQGCAGSNASAYSRT